MRIPSEEWEHLAPTHVGKIRANHQSDSCDGGRDSMIIERKADDSISCYCFRCGGRGYIHPTPSYVPPTTRVSRPAGLTNATYFGPPKDCHNEWTAYPREAREWLMQGGVTSVINAKQGIMWSDSHNKLWIPARQWCRTYSGAYKDSGYIVRGFNPKSYKVVSDNKPAMFGHYLNDVITNDCVLVEDCISAIKCSQVIDSIAILGVHPSSYVVEKILKEKYRRVFVFLDGDNSVVRLKAREIGKRLPFVETVVIETGKDPKEHTTEELKELLQ